jgi:hypothetical protein
MAADDMLLILNGLKGRTFVDLQSFPYFPLSLDYRESDLRFPSKIETISVLREVSPFTELASRKEFQAKSDDDSDGSGSSGSASSFDPMLVQLEMQDSILTLTRPRVFQKTPITMELLSEFANPPGDDPAHCCPAALYYWPELFASMSEPSTLIVNRRRDFLEAEDNIEAIREWARYHFRLGRSIRRSTGGVPDARSIGEAAICVIWQKLVLTCRVSETLMFVGETVVKRERLTSLVGPKHFVTINRHSLTLSIGPDIVLMDVSLAFATGISVTANRMFVTIDFEFGSTRVYRLHYRDREPKRISPMADFSWDLPPVSASSGVHAIVASVVGSKLVLWTIATGTIHRIVDVAEPILVCAVDEEVGCWVATASHGYFVSVNGEILAEDKLNETVTALAALQLPKSRTTRTAVAGTAAGAVYLVHPIVAVRRIDVIRLPSPHRFPVIGIIVSESAKSFVTTDADENCFVWAGTGSGVGDTLNVAMFEECGICHAKPGVVCTACCRAVCKRCISVVSESKCLLCAALDVY